MSKFTVISANYVNYKYDRIADAAISAHSAGKQLLLVLTNDDLKDATQYSNYTPESFKCTSNHFEHPDVVVFVDHRNKQRTELCLKEKEVGLYQKLKENQ